MAGTISLSLSQQFNSLGSPLSGGFLYFYAAGTTTPQSAYQDTSLTIPHPNPITLDASGRVPAFYLADGQIKIRLTDSTGVVQLAADNLLVIGPSSGTGTPPSVDATTLLQTGWVVPIYGTGSVTGFVRANGRTIGSASSGASERANADAQNLFTFLWQQDANLSVSTGRGASAAADWAANKTITLPDFRSRSITGLDDMGNSAASRLTTTYFGATATTLGAVGGSESHTLTAAELPANIPGTLSMSGVVGTNSSGPVGSGGSNPGGTASNNGTVNINPSGGGAHAGVGPRILITIYLKL